MKTINKLTIALGVAALAVSSCDLTEKPSSYYEKDTYFTSEGKARMAVVGAYDCLMTTKHYGQWEMALFAVDDITYFKADDNDGTRYDIGNCHVKADNTWLLSLWTMKYQGIDRANLAIDGIQHMAGYETSDVLKEIEAEARFLRAFLSLDLVKTWGDVPYKTNNTAVYDEAFLPRTDRDAIYDVIFDDLAFAKTYLNMGSASTSPETPVKGAAHALMMRAQLMKAGYRLNMDGTVTKPSDEVRKACYDAVITEWEEMVAEGYHGFSTLGYEGMFKAFSHEDLDSKESLYEIPFNPTGESYADNAGVWGTWNAPAVAAPGCKTEENGNFMGRANAFFRILPAWKNYFEDTDARRDVTVCDYEYKWDKTLYNHVKASTAAANWTPGKYRREWMKIGFVNPNNTGINYPVLRYADAVLMAAEAYNEKGNTAKAWELINSVRTRAGATAIDASNYATLLKAPKVLDLPFISDADEQGKVRTALYWERGFELAGEGFRKQDLLRWGVYKDAVTLHATGAPAKYVIQKYFTVGRDELEPIPLAEMQSNAKLENKQNPGYDK